MQENLLEAINDLRVGPRFHFQQQGKNPELYCEANNNSI